MRVSDEGGFWRARQPLTDNTIDTLPAKQNGVAGFVCPDFIGLSPTTFNIALPTTTSWPVQIGNFMVKAPRKNNRQ